MRGRFALSISAFVGSQHQDCVELPNKTELQNDSGMTTGYEAVP